MADIVEGKQVEIYSLVKPQKKYKTVSAGKTYKVIDKDEKFLYVVFFAKVKKKVFKSNRSLLATYKVIKKAIPITHSFDLIGKDIHKFEEQKDVKNHKEESKKEVNRIKLERTIADYIDKQVEIVLDGEKEKRKQLFLDELDRLRRKGFLFLYEHMEMTLSQVARVSSKKLSSEGWHFCFEYQKGDETMYHFQRPIQKKKVASNTK